MIVLAAMVAANTPVPLPTKRFADQAAVCDMTAPDGGRTALSVDFRYEKSYDQDGFWWTVLGDSSRYPSNKSFRNMYGYEHDRFSNVSGISFQVGDWHYSYTMYWEGGRKDLEGYLTPSGHLLVSRVRVLPSGAFDPSSNEHVGIGFCRLMEVSAQQ